MYQTDLNWGLNIFILQCIKTCFSPVFIHTSFWRGLPRMVNFLVWPNHFGSFWWPEVLSTILTKCGTIWRLKRDEFIIITRNTVPTDCTTADYSLKICFLGMPLWQEEVWAHRDTCAITWQNKYLNCTAQPELDSLWLEPGNYHEKLPWLR